MFSVHPKIKNLSFYQVKTHKWLEKNIAVYYQWWSTLYFISNKTFYHDHSNLYLSLQPCFKLSFLYTCNREFDEHFIFCVFLISIKIKIIHGTYKSSFCCVIDWLIDYLLFYVPLKNFSLIWRRHHCRWRAAKFRPMLGAQGLWAGRDLYRATPAVTRDHGFSDLIRRTAPFSRLLQHTRGCGGSILARILS
jgi:hypothetical protein